MTRTEKFFNWVRTVNVFESIKRFYGALIDLVGFIVDKTSEQGADIAIRALPIVSPLPNAISMYYVSQTALHFTDWQAKAFAAAMELALFGLFEVVLKMFDGWQKNPTRYSIPLRLATGIAVFVMILIIGVVAFVETSRPILATLPLFSAAGAAALSLRRWHAHNEQVDAEVERMRIEAKMQQKSVAKVAKSESPMQNQGISPILHDDSPVISDNVARMQEGKKAKILQRHTTILQLISGDGLSIADLAKQADCSPRTIRTDLETLQMAGHDMSINGVVKLNTIHINGNGVEVLHD